MIRKIIKIDEGRCNGCGLCVSACHEGAIGLVDGKARLLRDDYCDGLGDCLPVCPTDAITFEEREAAEYDEAAVKANMEKSQPETLACGCPGTYSKAIERDGCPASAPSQTTPMQMQTTPVQMQTTPAQMQPTLAETHLNQWPVQIKLVPPNAPYFKNANLLVAADCTAYAYGNFHDEYMKNRITLIGCPKLDEGDYSDKLRGGQEIYEEIRTVPIASYVV
jgi:NAD-dependent dihydropyrimidine dehydrogenase PreA subunit